MPVPDLIGKWDDVAPYLKGKRLFLFFDYDGTLAPIAATPERALLPRRTKRLLECLTLSPGCKVAVISGRPVEDLKRLVGVAGVIYSGNHGMEIEGPKLKFRAPIGAPYRRLLEQVKADLSARLAGIKGVIIEDKKYSLTLHYRMAQKKDISKIMTLFHEATIIPLVENKVKVASGKMVLELRPPTEWDKGRVVLWLLARQKFANAGIETVPVYIGDDTTDEDAFKALKYNGLTAAVGAPGQTFAQYSLADTDEVAKLMTKIIRLKQEEAHARAG